MNGAPVFPLTSFHRKPYEVMVVARRPSEDCGSVDSAAPDAVPVSFVCSVPTRHSVRSRGRVVSPCAVKMWSLSCDGAAAGVKVYHFMLVSVTSSRQR